jgi:hypothetical protein
MKDITYFYEVYEQTDEENDQWKLRSSHITEELAEQWIINLIEENSDYEDINFRIDECHDDRIQLI